MERFAVIMAGGSGERFWPLSRINHPKQLLKLTDPDRSLLQEAVDRIAPLVGRENVKIITARHLQHSIEESNCAEVGNVWAEPMKRNTLGALCWVAAKFLSLGIDQATLAILTADHKIFPEASFRNTVALAMETAEQSGGWVTCGIVPTRPETGYGYIELDRSETMASGAIRSAGFREKPDPETAQFFVESGKFLWNSGMFFFTLAGFSSELQHAQPEAHEVVRRTAVALAANRIDEAESAFAELPNLSIDYAVAEKARNLWVVEAAFEWDDVGAWDALSRSMPHSDGNGNVALGNCELIDVRNSVVYNDAPAIKTAIVGLDDLVVVLTDDALLVCPKGQSQRVKEIVERLKAEQSPLL